MHLSTRTDGSSVNGFLQSIPKIIKSSIGSLGSVEENCVRGFEINEMQGSWQLINIKQKDETR